MNILSSIKARIFALIASIAAFIHGKVTKVEKLPTVQDAVAIFNAALEQLQAIAIFHEDEAEYQQGVAAEAHAAAAASADEAASARAIAQNIANIVAPKQ